MASQRINLSLNTSLNKNQIWQFKPLYSKAGDTCRFRKAKPIIQIRMKNVISHSPMLPPISAQNVSQPNISYLNRTAAKITKRENRPNVTFESKNKLNKNKFMFRVVRNHKDISLSNGNILSIKKSINSVKQEIIKPDFIDNKLIVESINKWKENIIKPKPIKPLRHRMIKILAKLKQLGLIPIDLKGNKIFSSVPYERPYSKEFINACKYDDSETVTKLISKDRFIVFTFDYTKKTGLHWVTIRGYHRLMLKLLDAHADPDSKDMAFKTPLHYSIKNQDILACICIISQNATVAQC